MATFTTPGIYIQEVTGPGVIAGVGTSTAAFIGPATAGPLLDRGVTGIVCGSDVMALGVIRAARSRGLRVPEDLSVVGSDDSQMMEFTDPPLTTVRQPAEALAQAASEEIAEQMAGARPHAGEVLYRPELVVRGSTARAPSTG